MPPAAPHPFAMAIHGALLEKTLKQDLATQNYLNVRDGKRKSKKTRRK